MRPLRNSFVISPVVSNTQQNVWVASKWAKCLILSRQGCATSSSQWDVSALPALVGTKRHMFYFGEHSAQTPTQNWRRAPCESSQYLLIKLSFWGFEWNNNYWTICKLFDWNLNVIPPAPPFCFLIVWKPHVCGCWLMCLVRIFGSMQTIAGGSLIPYPSGTGCKVPSGWGLYCRWRQSRSDN